MTQNQLMIDIYGHLYLVEQEDTIVRVVPIEERHNRRFFVKKRCLLIKYANKREIICSSIEEANRIFFEKAKEDYYNCPINWNNLGAKVIKVEA